MHEDDGGIWLGTDGGGLVHFRAERFTLTTSKVGLYSDKIAEILEDDQGNLWMTSDRGVFRVLKEQLSKLEDRKLASIDTFAYGKTDGMKSAECASNNQPTGWKMRDGTLWFATINIPCIDGRLLPAEGVGATSLESFYFLSEPGRAITKSGERVEES